MLETGEKILHALSGRDGDISPEELTKHLGIPEHVLVEEIESLRALGYGISLQPERGYRLMERPDRLLPMEIRDGLSTTLIGRRIVCLRETNSTNDVALNLARHGSPEGTVIFAEVQTAGRGRMGRSWFAPPGKAVLLSVILKPESSLTETPPITLMAAVAAAEAIREASGLPASIRWPNDLIVKGRKAGGILTERTSAGDGSVALVVGLGINVNLDEDDLPQGIRRTATSLKIEAGAPVNRPALVRAVLRHLEQEYLILKSGGFEPIIMHWRTLSSTLGHHVRAHLPNRTIEGQAMDIDEHGELIVRHDDGSVEKLSAGKVTLLDA